MCGGWEQTANFPLRIHSNSVKQHFLAYKTVLVLLFYLMSISTKKVAVIVKKKTYLMRAKTLIPTIETHNSLTKSMYHFTLIVPFPDRKHTLFEGLAIPGWSLGQR